MKIKGPRAIFSPKTGTRTISEISIWPSKKVVNIGNK